MKILPVASKTCETSKTSEQPTVDSSSEESACLYKGLTDSRLEIIKIKHWNATHEDSLLKKSIYY